jgi:hypothetical protein
MGDMLIAFVPAGPFLGSGSESEAENAESVVECEIFLVVALFRGYDIPKALLQDGVGKQKAEMTGRERFDNRRATAGTLRCFHCQCLLLELPVNAG